MEPKQDRQTERVLLPFFVRRRGRAGRRRFFVLFA
jgi:hypothetical protein